MAREGCTRTRYDVDIALRAGLIETAGAVPTFASVGLERRAAAVASIAGSSWDYLAELLEHRPDVQVLVLSEADCAAKCEERFRQRRRDTCKFGGGDQK